MAGVGFDAGRAAGLRAGVPALPRAVGAAGASVLESGRAALESVEAVSFDSGALDSAAGDFAAGELGVAAVGVDDASPAAGCVADAPEDPAGAELLGAGLLGAELLGPELLEPAFAEAELSVPGVVPAPCAAGGDDASPAEDGLGGAVDGSVPLGAAPEGTGDEESVGAGVPGRVVGCTAAFISVVSQENPPVFQRK